MKKILLTAFALSVAAASQASGTMATFADPSTLGDSSLFTWDHTNSTLSGLWTASGLNLDTPGFNGGGSVANAHFSMDAVSLTTVIPNTLYTMGPGSIHFFTNDPNNPFFTIDFNGGLFLNPFSAGASELSGNTVSFSGPNVPSPLQDEQFSFAFANAQTVGDITTFTASFTSSATVVPEPATLLALGAGLAAFAARRRKA
ncbi:MAG: PEP-CTERM sorting domain-containing protein [Armatimonadetes bacterium]|nr:PEP-CTERM sorting domain-containing protein [Armatimonadota bacterium]